VEATEDFDSFYAAVFARLVGQLAVVTGDPALLDHDPVNHFLEVTWREPGGIELVVHAEEELGRRQLLAIAEGLRQP
jgi:hypothetical protein